MLNIQKLEQLRADVQNSLPPGFEAVKWVYQDDKVSQGNVNPENIASFEIIVVSHDHNVVIQGRVGFCVGMAQKFAMGGDHVSFNRV